MSRIPPTAMPGRALTALSAAMFFLVSTTGVAAPVQTSPAQAGAVANPSCASYRIRWATLDAGGGRIVGPNAGWRIDATIGQSEPELAPLCSGDGGAACAGALFTLRGGFWPGRDLIPAGVDCLFGDGFESVGTPPGA
jgi:hypothetical protein